MPETGTGTPREPWLAKFARDDSRARQAEIVWTWAGRAVIVIAILAVWQLLNALRVFNPQLMSSPSAILAYLWSQLGLGSFWQPVWITFQEMILGLIIGVVVGAGLGLCFALLRRFSEAMEPIIGGINAVPKIALAPLAVVWLGLGIGSKILMAAIGVFFVVFFNVVTGAKDLDPALRQNAEVLGLSRAEIVRTVLIPFTLVWVTTALRVSVSLALLGAIIGEYVGSNNGLGYEINTSANSLSVTEMFALLLTLMIIGALLYLVVTIAERRILRWQS